MSFVKRQSKKLPQSSLSAMRNLKTNPVSSRSVANRGDGAAPQNEAGANKTTETQYPTIWKKAFALGQNVRFTRTPEVELVRKRVENDPDFAEKLKAFELEQRRRRENVPAGSTGYSTPEPTSDSRSDAVEQGQKMVRALQDEVVLAVQRKNIEQAESRIKDSAETHSIANREIAINDASNTVLANVQNQTGEHKPLYLSDSAFFECGPDILAGLSQIFSQQATEPASNAVSLPVKAKQVTVVEMPFEIDAPQPEVKDISGAMATSETAANVSSEVAIRSAKNSITDLYRVLECRFPKNSKQPTGKSENTGCNEPSTGLAHENQSSASVILQDGKNESFTPLTGRATVNEVTVPGNAVNNQPELAVKASFSAANPAVTSALTQTLLPQVVTPQPVNSVVTAFNNQGEVVIENTDSDLTDNAFPEEPVVTIAPQTLVENSGGCQTQEMTKKDTASAEIIEDIEPVTTDGTAQLPADNTPPSTSATPHKTEVASVRENTQKPLSVTTKATISAPFRTLNPAFIPSPKAESGNSYIFPSIDLLQEPEYKDGAVISQETLERSAGLLESVLEDFGIKGEIIHVRPGPVVTMYEFEPAAGVKSSRVISLSDDIARSMSAISARVAVIPGRNVIGIELPNKVRETVYLREIIQSKAFQDSNYKLPLALGKNIGGEPVIAELAKMPHLLVAGTTGSGKSVAINAMILSLLYRLKPEQCRLIMVDPKMLELSIYDGIPHLLTPVVTDPKKAVTALKWAVREMEDRYRKMAKLGVRNIDGFNQRVSVAAEKGETITCRVQSGFDKETGEMLYHEEAMDLSRLPYIVIIVDEMADLMMVAGKEIEGAIQRLAQMARAAGIHLIMATQRPSVDVITGTIKANFPTRISFQVTSKIDSRTILGEQGAETLLGQGDMLHMVGGGRIVRVHGPFVSDEEVEHVVAHLKTQGTPDYLATVTDGEDEEETIEDADSIADIVAAGSAGENMEELYLQAVKVVMRDKKCSTSYIQRRLGIGYNKAATLVERMEAEGIVGPANHVGKREILLNSHHNHEGFAN